MHLQIETTSFCNAKCLFCPHPFLKRPKGTMSDGLFQEILEESLKVPEITRIYLQGLGEPLIDKKIEDRVLICKELQPKIPVSIYTNGSLLTKKKIRDLFSSGLDELVISLSGTSKEERAHSMGLDDYDHVVSMAKYAIELYGTRISVKLIQARDLVEVDSAQKFMDLWGDNAFITYEGNWAGETGKFRGKPHKNPCMRALDQIMILWQGDIVICCFDSEGSIVYGNIKDTPMRDILLSPEACEIRQLHLSGNRDLIPLCKGCTGI